MADLLIPFACVFLGLALLALEMFVPSAGLLGVTATLLLVGGVVSSFFYGGVGVGTTFLAGTCVATGMMISLLIKWWPQTPLGKLILPENATLEEVLPDRSHLASMIGRVGQARSLMLPGGIIDIDGKRFGAIAANTVEQGTWVKVTGTQGTDLVVRPIAEEEARRTGKPSMGESTAFPDPFGDALG